MYVKCILTKVIKFDFESLNVFLSPYKVCFEIVVCSFNSVIYYGNFDSCSSVATIPSCFYLHTGHMRPVL